jgi:hypothetical protein
MSIRAMNWALLQRTDSPAAQCVLYVIADTANERGVSVHADPDYIAEHTRQSRATVFRKLKELEEAGALSRFIHHQPDGRRVYEVRLSMERQVNYRVGAGGAIVHIEGDESTDPPDAEGGSQIETDAAQSQSETVAETGISPVRQGESHSCDPQESPPTIQDSPPTPPSRGGDVPDAQFEEFRNAYPIPVVNMAATRQFWAALTDKERGLAKEGAAAYGRFCKAERRKALDAHRWLRDRKWEGFVGRNTPASAQPRVFVEEGTEAWRAHAIFEACYGRSLQTTHYGGKMGWWFASEFPPFGRGLEQDKRNWAVVEHGTRQWWAWQERLKQHRPQGSPSRQEIVDGRVTQGWRFPSEWPPGKNSATEPAQSDAA